MPQAHYTVDAIDGVWRIGIGGKSFGPYSSLDTAMAAAAKAARKAEAEGFEALVTVNGPETPLAADDDQDAQAA